MKRELIKKTISRCTICGEGCSAVVSKEGGNIFLERNCPTDGYKSFRIGPAEFYWQAAGHPANACCGNGNCCSVSGQNVGTLGSNATQPSNIEDLSTCTALIDIVDSCNLKCPTCFASSPFGIGENLKYIPLPELQHRIQSVITRKGKIELLQLSGGEPTLHPQFFDLLIWAFDHPGIDHVLVNTNGVKLAADDDFLTEFQRILRPKKMRLYLQYDGPQEAGQKELRDADLRRLRIKAIERAGEIGLSIHLAMTVNEYNLAYLWESLTFGAEYSNVLGISYQPMFLSGRSLGNLEDQPISGGDIALGLIEQSQGIFTTDDFTPLPCGDPNCQIVSGVMRHESRLIPVVRFIDRANINQVLRDKIDFDIEALKQCGCEGQPLAEFLKDKVLLPEHGFFIFIKPFMDARSWDKDRIDRCCTHVIGKDGKLYSFCEYYSGLPGVGQSARVEVLTI